MTSKHVKNALVIVESPAKCKKIEGFLGPGYKCVASYGHITTLQSLKDVDVENHFKPSFKMIESKKQQIQRLEGLIKKCDEVVLSIADNGTLQIELKNLTEGDGTGLKNVNQRLKTLYDKELQYSRNSPSGLIVSMTIPATE